MSYDVKKVDDSDITVLMNEFEMKKETEYLFLSSDRATLDVITELLCNAGSDFIAVERDTFSQNKCHILSHIPKFADMGRFETYTEKAQKFEKVVICNQKYPIQLTEIEHRRAQRNNLLVLYDEVKQNESEGEK